MNPAIVEEVFSAAVALEATQRAEYLTGACGGDAHLLHRVEALLRAYTASGRFLPDESGSRASTEASEPGRATVLEQPGNRIGRYKLLQKIGEGGCGVVYEAEQEEPVRRQVALKVIKLGMDTRAVIARFEAERQTLALMDHPNIARVLDAGATENGRPYFVMELVPGVKITDFCDENNLPTHERLELFIRVCRAVQHAHQKGVLHRDIKPSNILVRDSDGMPFPKIIDFGIAKATTSQLLAGPSPLTEVHHFMGTPAYMSPEQAMPGCVDIDTRTDIYSLGVLLYELLTGKTPFDDAQLLNAGLDQVRKAILEKDPVPPSARLRNMPERDLLLTARHRRAEPRSLVQLLSGDVDCIVMKALEKDRVRRYETVNGLAMDTRRFLENEPIEARAPGSLYRFQKLVHRNRVLFAAGGGVIMALILGLAVSTWLFLKETAARQRAVVAERAQSRLLQEARQAEATESRLRREAEVARQNEVELRRKAEANERVLRVQLLLAQGKEDEAERLINEGPPALALVQAMYRIGFQHAVHKEWGAAQSNFTAIVAAAPTEHLAYHFLAAIHLQTRDFASYEQLRRLILNRFSVTTNSLVAERMAKDCLILPPAEADLPAINQMTDTALRAGKQHWAWVYFQNAKGLAEFRMGQFTNAINRMQAVVKVAGDPRREVEAYSVLAMAHQQMHHLEEAQAALQKANEVFQREFPEINKFSDPDWNDQLLAQALLLEAKQALSEPPPPVK
ncbi:MAG TPA: protein kinase [Verrucomicrobiae bacterium]|nr:protein kinase [Verrucomicrobiae bacterium]